MHHVFHTLCSTFCPTSNISTPVDLPRLRTHIHNIHVFLHHATAVGSHGPISDSPQLLSSSTKRCLTVPTHFAVFTKTWNICVQQAQPVPMCILETHRSHLNKYFSQLRSVQVSQDSTRNDWCDQHLRHAIPLPDFHWRSQSKNKHWHFLLLRRELPGVSRTDFSVVICSTVMWWFTLTCFGNRWILNNFWWDKHAELLVLIFTLDLRPSRSSRKCYGRFLQVSDCRNGRVTVCRRFFLDSHYLVKSLIRAPWGVGCHHFTPFNVQWSWFWLIALLMRSTLSDLSVLNLSVADIHPGCVRCKMSLCLARSTHNLLSNCPCAEVTRLTLPSQVGHDFLQDNSAKTARNPAHVLKCICHSPTSD